MKVTAHCGADLVHCPEHLMLQSTVDYTWGSRVFTHLNAEFS